MKNMSIRFKITFFISLSILLTILVILFISARNQRQNLMEASDKTLTTNTQMLNSTIRNLMLKGEAPIVVRTLEDMQKIPDIEELELYRTDGTRAFHDYKTLNQVNGNLGKKMFMETPRIEYKSIDNDNFQKVLDSNAPGRMELKNPRAIEYYFPVLNVPECRECHGSDHFIRGVSYFRLSTADVYDQIRQANIILVAIFIIAGLIIGFILLTFLKRVIITPLLSMRRVVSEVAEGDFSPRVEVKRGDEIGELGDEVNRMIVGLEERFKLSKYVSRSTDDVVRGRGEVREEGKRQILTVLFSDIRSFTSYSEKHGPREVIKNLNRILQVQALEIERFNGDVDKFIGDAVMAIFQDEYSAVRSAYEMIKCVNNVNRDYDTGLHIGIGVNSGEVILGNIGTENRMEYAVIGDTVNLAARLSGQARPDMLLVSETVMAALEGRVTGKFIPNQSIKGKTSKINFYIITSVLDHETMRWLS